MSEKNIYVTQPYLPNIDRYKSYVDTIFQNKYLTNSGPLVKKLEKRLADYLWVKNIILVSNGTLALQISFKALNLKGNVITTPFSFVATTSSLVWQGLNPVFVDIDKDSLNINPELIEENIDSNTSAILATHVFWNTCNVEEIEKICRKNNIKTIYDAAHSFGSTYRGENVLNYGDISILSFHATKIFHTIEGWAIIVNDDEIADQVRKMVNFWIDQEGTINEVWINSKMNEFQAAMGLCVLDEINTISYEREKIGKYYDHKINDSIWRQYFSWETKRNFSYYPIICKSEENLQKLIDDLHQKNIFPRRYFYPSLNQLPYVTYIEMAVSEDISKRILCLPIYPWLERETIDIIINIVNNA